MVIVETIRDLAITIGLAILIPLTLTFGFHAFLTRPEWKGSEELTKAEKIAGDLRQRVHELKEEKKFEEAHALTNQIEDAEAAAQKLRQPLDDSYNQAIKKYSWIYLTIAVAVGAALIVTSMIIHITFISAGVLFGGVACVVIGATSNWYRIPSQLQFFILLGAIIALIALSYFFFMRARKNQ